MAERWTAIRDVPQLPFLRRSIERYGGPALDLACGAGRLLVPLRAAGVDVDGADISQDMIDRCREQVQRAGLSANLYCQQMDQLDLPRRYRTIYMCDSFGLAGSRQRDLDALRRCHSQLEDGGALIFNGVEADYTSPDSWDQWLPEGRRALPEPWPAEGSRRAGVDGTEHVAFFRTLDLDPLEQTYTREVRLEKWQAGELVASEQYTLRGNTYLKPEVELMLRTAGFGDITVRSGWTDEPATADSEDIVFIAIR